MTIEVIYMFKETLILCVGILFHQEMTNIWMYKENWKKKKLSTINVKYCVGTWNTVSPRKMHISKSHNIFQNKIILFQTTNQVV
jgi:hypothetical protein